MHKFASINIYPPQNRYLPALKPYLLGRDNIFNAVWQTQIRYTCQLCSSSQENTRSSLNPQHTYPSSARGSVCCTYTCYLLLTHRAFCFRARHRGITGCMALALVHRQACSLCKSISPSLG